MEPIEHRAKMQPRPEAPEGLETDGKGNVIPLDQRLPEDQTKAVGQGLKNPNHEAENPAPMPAPVPERSRASPFRQANDDPAGQQGGQHGGGRDGSPPQP